MMYQKNPKNFSISITVPGTYNLGESNSKVTWNALTAAEGSLGVRDASIARLSATIADAIDGTQTLRTLRSPTCTSVSASVFGGSPPKIPLWVKQNWFLFLECLTHPSKKVVKWCIVTFWEVKDMLWSTIKICVYNLVIVKFIITKIER